MSFVIVDKGFVLAAKAASAISDRQPVQVDTAADGQVVLAATHNVEPFAFTDASAVQGGAVTVYGEGCVVRAIAAASLGAGANVGIGSTNGRLAPVSGASGVTRFRAGKSLENAADGDSFALYISPRQLSNLI